MSESVTNHESLEHGAYIRRADMAVALLFRGKWQIQVLCAMRWGPVRIGQLSRMIPGASKNVLAQSLRKLEAHGVVIRNDLSGLVLHVEYELRPEVQASLITLLDHISQWGGGFFSIEGQRWKPRSKE